MVLKRMLLAPGWCPDDFILYAWRCTTASRKSQLVCTLQPELTGTVDRVDYLEVKHLITMRWGWGLGPHFISPFPHPSPGWPAPRPACCLPFPCSFLPCSHPVLLCSPPSPTPCNSPSWPVFPLSCLGSWHTEFSARPCAGLSSVMSAQTCFMVCLQPKHPLDCSPRGLFWPVLKSVKAQRGEGT